MHPKIERTTTTAKSLLVALYNQRDNLLSLLESNTTDKNLKDLWDKNEQIIDKVKEIYAMELQANAPNKQDDELDELDEKKLEPVVLTAKQRILAMKEKNLQTIEKENLKNALHNLNKEISNIMPLSQNREEKPHSVKFDENESNERHQNASEFTDDAIQCSIDSDSDDAANDSSTKITPT